jgi:hypothetical protein
MKKLTRNQMKNEIRKMKESVPGGKIRENIYIKKVCNKHIQVLHTADKNFTETMGIEEFYSCYV